MTTNHHICVWNPPRYAHAPLLWEIAQLLIHSLESLGRQVTIAHNSIVTGKHNIVLGYHMAVDPAYLKLAPCSLFQLEPLLPADDAFIAKWMPHFSRATQVWDYSVANIDRLQAAGLKNVRHVPFGYHPKLKRITRSAEKDIDVAFYGSVNVRRQTLLRELQDKCKLSCSFGAYGDDRDEQIRRSKIVLNMHKEPGTMLEQSRISYLMNNDCFFISEDSCDAPYPWLETVPYEKLVETCLDYLNRADDRERIAAESGRQFASMRMTEILALVL